MTIRKLGRGVVCTRFELQSPIWGGGKPHVGLAEHRITDHNEIEIMYIRKRDGKRTYPDKYYFDGTKLNNIDYERQNVRGLTLVIVPFSDLEILQRVEKELEPGSVEELIDWAKDDRYAQTKLELDNQ